ncbi:MAG: hypothetical protein FJ295_20300 [Planctomycetes bacterium]|nr:hypothetical protein [Planctomycetota bacterium]
MSNQYDNLGLKFLFPENWTIAEELASGWPRSVTLLTPDGGFWVAQLHSDGNPHDLTMQALKAMRDEYKQLESDPVLESIAGRDIHGFDMRFYCLDLLVGSAVRGVSLGRHDRWTLLVMYQAEDREFDRLQPVFEAIFSNLLANFDAKPSIE